MSIFPGVKALLSSMIECSYHPTKTDKPRLAIAEEMLLGKNPNKESLKKKVGRKEINDEELMYRISTLVENGKSIRAATRECVGEFPGHSFDSTVDRLRKKFAKNKEKYTNTTYEKALEQRKAMFAKQEQLLTLLEETIQEDNAKTQKSLRQRGWPV